MALTCARCGAQNPDGNAFCQACGTPLTAAARVAPPASPWPAPPPPPGSPPAGPPPGPPMAPPPGAPAGVIGPPPGLAPPVQTMGGGYQSPYYVPAVPHAPVHRTPWMMIIAGVVGLVIVMAGCGTVLAVIGSRGTVTGSVGVTSGLPSPSPGGSPSPLVSPPSTGPTTASNTIASVTVPAGWSVAAKDAVSITLGDPNGNGFMTIESSRLNAAVTPQQVKDQVDQKLKSQYPDTKPCPNSTTTAITLNNAKGLFWTNCFTYTSGTRAVPEAAAFYASASADGTVYWMVSEVTAPPSNLQNVINECKPIVQGIQWKLT